MPLEIQLIYFISTPPIYSLKDKKMELTLHKIISLISWLFLVVTSLVSFYNPIKLSILFDVKMFWLSVSAEELQN